MKKNQDQGFTLVELLIVIVILGILATVTVFAVRGITTDAQSNACATELKTLQTASQSYFAANPAVTAIPGDSSDARFATLVTAGLLADTPTTHTIDANGNPTGIGDCA